MAVDNLVVVAVETVERMVVGVDVFDETVDVTVFPNWFVFVSVVNEVVWSADTVALLLLWSICAI